MTQAAPRFDFDNTYAAQLEGFYTPWQADEAPAPKLMQFNEALAVELGLDPMALASEAGLAVLAGNAVPEGATPLAQAYAGHQFGGFSPQLGDGRALMLGEVIDTNGRRRDIQLKGSGRTPFSRGGDGKAAVGPVLREYLIGEAMYALGIPTTRALAAVSTGEPVMRETMLPGAILTRVAASHIRVGTFQFFASRGENDKVRQLADYAIARHYPDAARAANPYLALLEAVSEAQASLIAKWMSVGFIHGVMNTDNMTISGETIDYGPCAFMDRYAADTVFSSIDQTARYAYANQPAIAQWNLARLAETLITLVDADTDKAIEILTDSVNAFPALYGAKWLEAMRPKLGLAAAEDGDFDLITGLLSLMEAQGRDFTLTFRHLAAAQGGDVTAFQAQVGGEGSAWLGAWRERLEREDATAEVRAAAMLAVNPHYIPRNQKVEEALNAAVYQDDLSPFKALLAVLSDPFTAQDVDDSYAQPAPLDAAPYRTFCGT